MADCVKCGRRFTPVAVENGVSHIACPDCVSAVMQDDMDDIARRYYWTPPQFDSWTEGDHYVMRVRSTLMRRGEP